MNRLARNTRSPLPDTCYWVSGIGYRGVGFFLILLLALGLRLYRLDAQSLWNDEGTSVALAQRDLATIARDAAQDIHPPLYYWLLSGWLRLTGSSEFALRALSAFLGVVLVALTYALGRLLAGKWVGLAAAFLAAINPFQIYYSQEARMYMLLAVCSALAFYAALRWLAAEMPPLPSPLQAERSGGDRGGAIRLPWSLVYVLAAAAGLYTHYAFPMVLLAVNLVVLLDIGLRRLASPQAGGTEGGRHLWPWLALQAAVALLYLPWLPVAVRQLMAWPSPAQTTAFLPALADTWRWLNFGPTVETGQVVLPLLAMGLLAVLGALALLAGRGAGSILSGRGTAALLVLWLCLPVALMFILGLYREAYLKFLLVASPAVVLLLALGVPRPTKSSSRIIGVLAWLTFILTASLVIFPYALALHNYYTDPTFARDDYRSIAAYVEAVSQSGDTILLNAPGQQEVFGYYYHGNLPVHPLPQGRPLDPAATEAALAEMAQPGARVFAVLWATDESDPQRFVEGWLDTNTYKALDTWYGNVRLAVYAVPERTPDAPEHALNVRLQNAETDDEITLLGYSQLNERLAAGDIAQITLFWQAERTPVQRYKAFLHVLDADNHIVGQRDAEPGGGARLTTLWQPGEVVADNYGLPIHPATPPGDYRIEVGLYNPETGQRLLTPGGEGQVWLQPLIVEQPPAPAPVAALGMQHAADASFGELSLLGYDAYRLGFAHQPDAPLRPGDALHVNLYWQAETQPSGDWQVRISLVDSDGQEATGFTAEPVGGYPTGKWQAGDVWRGQFNLLIPGDAPPGRYRLRVQPTAPDGSAPAPFLTKPLIVHP